MEWYTVPILQTSYVKLFVVLEGWDSPKVVVNINCFILGFVHGWISLYSGEKGLTARVWSTTAYRDELMRQNCPFDTWHAIMSVVSGNKMYCSSNLMVRYSSWIEYLNDFLRFGWTNGILCILNRWNWSDLSTRGMCSTTYKVFEIMNDCSFIKLYIHNMFSPFHSGKANFGCDTNCASNLISSDIRSNGFSKVGWVLGTYDWNLV